TSRTKKRLRMVIIRKLLAENRRKLRECQEPSSAFFGYPSGVLRLAVEEVSNNSRTAVEAFSKQSRTSVEEQSKPSRSRVEQVSKSSRRAVEQQLKKLL